MRFYGLATILSLLLLVAGCGHLPSDMKDVYGAHASVRASDKPDDKAAKVHITRCTARARGYKRVRFSRLYEFTGDGDQPFRRAQNTPTQYDVYAYVWGFQSCEQTGDCENGDHYWLIERGPGNDFSTWVVTPQYPRIVVQSRCRNKLKVGERYRFSFSNGQLVGFTR